MFFCFAGAKSVTDILRRVDVIEYKLRRLDAIEDKLEKIMSAMTDLQASVSAEDTVLDSAVTLIKGFAAQLTAAGTDPVALAALKTDIDAHAQSLAAAVAANTPAAAPPAPPASPMSSAR